MSENIKNHYPANTHKSKEKVKVDSDIPEKKVEKVVEGVHRKKGLGKRIAETFTGDDARNVGEYVLFDVMIPAAKAMISDAASQGVERMLFGDVRRPRGSAGSRSAYTSYNRMSTPSSPGRAFEPDGPRQLSKRARANHDFGEVIIPDRGKAELVLDRMGELLDMYGMVTVSDFYDLVDITGSYTDDKWGWYDLRSARVVRDRAGYVIDLPQPNPID